MSRALHASPSDLATGVAAVAVATIARAADVEALGAHAAANLPEAVLHESPCERAEKLSPRRGSCETNRASVCCRVPESPGSSPGLSLFRRAACRRSLGSARAPANFPAARARPRRYDVSGGNLRIGEAINSPLQKAAMGRRMTADPWRIECSPRAPGAQDEEDGVQGRAVRNTWVVTAERMRLPRGQQGLHLRPECVGQPPAIVLGAFHERRAAAPPASWQGYSPGAPHLPD